MKWLHKIIDDSLREMSKTEISMMTPANIPVEMQDDSIKKMDDWSGWKPTRSIIEDSDINKLEKDIGFPLPLSYREFLKTKHFFKLRIPDRAVNLPGMLPNKELSFLKELVFEMMEPEFLIGRGYIYFADFEDYGLLCFNANETAENNEYPIVYIDHEDIDDIHLYAKNFKELMEADGERGNRFIDYLNDYHKQKTKAQQSLQNMPFGTLRIAKPLRTIKIMTISEIIYHHVEESFGMGGPYIGTLEFKGQFLKGEFLADGEKLSQDKKKLIFSQFNGIKKSGLFGLGRQRMFHILIYDEIENEFYQSVKSYESLSIEKMEDDLITFHEAFLISTDEFRQTTKFNENSFNKIEKEKLLKT